MIRDEHELSRALDAMGDLQRALAALRREYSQSSPSAFALLAEGPLDEIRRLQLEIDAFTGLTVAERAQAPLWMKLVGPKARWGETPASVVTAFLDALRKGVQSIAGYELWGRTIGRPPGELQSACDLEIALFAPGSFEVGVRLPEPSQGQLVQDQYRAAAKSALDGFLIVAGWASLEQPDPILLAHAFPDFGKRRLALRAVKPFVPRRQGGIDFVELYGAMLDNASPIHLAPESADRIASELEAAVAEHEESHEGDIREMDLDKRTFRLRNVLDVGEVRCQFPEDLASQATDLLGKRVRLIGTRTVSADGSASMLIVTDIEKIESRSQSG